jgi:hypothetical protein
MSAACCPHCGHDEYFVKLSMRGTTEYNARFDGRDGADNSEMHNALYYVEGKFRYCSKCRKNVGKNVKPPHGSQ